PHSEIHSLVRQFVAPTGQQGFHINESHQSGEVVPLVLPDIAVCPECLKEMLDPADRRYGYPFINCTHCGPRISIVDSLPYDRPNTTMAHFALCPDCRAEYENPTDRRFHAQPIACPVCGPQLAFHEKPGESATAIKQDALDQAIESLERGEILALKGLGGFQLLADAANAQTVRRLRIRKRRGNKPFAVMFPDLEAVRKAAICSAAEEKLMKSSEAPIVLVLKGNDHFEAAAPRNPYLGVFLPYTPLHHLLLQGFGRPVIATSGNKFNEPICISNEEAFDRLRHLADTFLVHDRPIERAVDDSVTRIVNAEPFIIRRARGFAPLPIRLKETLPDSLAVGGHLKNTIAAGKKNQIILSQHIGNLDTVESVRAHQRAKEDFKKLYGLKPAKVVVDDHPDYVSRQFALKEPEA
ncbi:MAG: carbamoyltransferase HypF, partial [Verrucomicrobiae bacterium]|nr:carbamoyltransferase HypF [Verrucomicrobiae bacterium]